jgi:SNF2 family DNA or RNA helicase
MIASLYFYFREHGDKIHEKSCTSSSTTALRCSFRFQNPIANGQHLDSTKKDIQTMKRRSHVLHKLLQGFVQRKDQRLLQHMLPPKSVYVISVRLSPLQRRLYQRLLDAIPSKQGKHGKNYLFQAYQSLTKVRVREFPSVWLLRG